MFGLLILENVNVNYSPFVNIYLQTELLCVEGCTLVFVSIPVFNTTTRLLHAKFFKNKLKFEVIF